MAFGIDTTDASKLFLELSAPGVESLIQGEDYMVTGVDFDGFALKLLHNR